MVYGDHLDWTLNFNRAFLYGTRNALSKEILMAWQMTGTYFENCN